MRALSAAGAILATALAFGTASSAAAQAEPPSSGGEVVDLAVTPNGREWWVAEADGRVSTTPLGDVQVQCPPPEDLGGAVRSIERTASGQGYWLATSTGQVLTCGDAGHFGDLATDGVVPNGPVVGIAAAPDGRGYWLAASDGGVFAYGSASFAGSAGAIALNAPVVGIASAGADGGYWLVASDGGVFSYGDADFHGSLGGIALNRSIVGITRSPTGGGYYLLGGDGGIFSFGDAVFAGSRYTLPDADTLTARFVGIDAASGRGGYSIVDAAGVVHAFALDPSEPTTSDEIVTSPRFPGTTADAAQLVDVRLAGRATVDRFVFEFADRVPEYRVRYVDPPVRLRPLGRVVDVAGSRFVEITAATASGVDLGGAVPRTTYTGPDRLRTAGTEVVTEAVAIEDFENRLSWVLGLDRRAGVDVYTLGGPPRIVVDISHDG